MKKHFFTLIGVLCTIFAFGQVGINTEEPTETLDINGTLRIRGGDHLISNTEPWLLTASDSGVVKKLPANTFSPVMLEVEANALFNDTVKVTIPPGYENFQLDISCENSCNRWIYSSMRYIGRETILLGASARGMSVGTDATLTTIGIPAGGESWGASFHVFWNRTKVVGCNPYGNVSSTENRTSNYLYDFWIRRTGIGTISFVWGAINNRSQLQSTAIESATLKWNFLFTKL